MSFPDLTDEIRSRVPDLRGRLTPNARLGDITWFRVGGPAQMLFSPADEADLAAFLKGIDGALPVQVIGLGSNLLVRDGGLEGVVIRLGRGFAGLESPDPQTIVAGTALPDVKLARAAADAETSGLSFYRGIPGSIGGALRMNAGAHGSETKDVLVSARAVDPAGTVHVMSNADMGFTYRHCAVPDDWIFTEATFAGEPGRRDTILAAMDEVAEYREANQPIKERTGGSTFKNPPGHSAWKLVDDAGLRGFRVGGAHMSEKHCNFMINDREATGQDLETLGEIVRRRVRATSGVELQWEIKRIGAPLPGIPIGDALADSDDTKSSAA
ncbi:MAG: UDP-N-acetylmuramate dehydrogenase [Pseudomonadota bacterium]